MPRSPVVVSGRLVPYRTPAQVRNDPVVWEEFCPGAFRECIERGQFDRIPLRYSHDFSVLPVGRCLALRENTDGLYGTFQFGTTDLARTVGRLVAEGVLQHFSVEMTHERDRVWIDRYHYIITRADLSGCGMVHEPVYRDARIETLDGVLVRDGSRSRS